MGNKGMMEKLGKRASRPSMESGLFWAVMFSKGRCTPCSGPALAYYMVEYICLAFREPRALMTRLQYFLFYLVSWLVGFCCCCCFVVGLQIFIYLLFIATCLQAERKQLRSCQRCKAHRWKVFLEPERDAIQGRALKDV